MNSPTNLGANTFSCSGVQELLEKLVWFRGYTRFSFGIIENLEVIVSREYNKLSADLKRISYEMRFNSHTATYRIKWIDFKGLEALMKLPAGISIPLITVHLGNLEVTFLPSTIKKGIAELKAYADKRQCYPEITTPGIVCEDETEPLIAPLWHITDRIY